MIIESAIDGEFEGTEDEVVYRLENGDRWQQIGYNYNYSYSYRPRVRIDTSTSPNTMRVDGFSYAIPVRRLD